MVLWANDRLQGAAHTIEADGAKHAQGVRRCIRAVVSRRSSAGAIAIGRRGDAPHVVGIHARRANDWQAVNAVVSLGADEVGRREG